ncbi:hypothetical protein JMJ35_008139 [Cladonia borealis]|uniref:PSI domain-containing protein n=1 Tax=Cladonia borealis TaxID=184061 RepID=A0AA39V794_9LECA|nr:hypothetical protein JMJ35_008139 [Cladonia borealis]
MLTGLPEQQRFIAPNISAAPPNPDRDPDLLLPHCWRLQDCTGCLEARYHCSWCPISSICVPNPATWPLLTPISNPDICPLHAERWELRGNEFGCAVSTVTFLSVIVSIASTFALIALVWALGRAWTWSRMRWRGWIAIAKKQIKEAGRWVVAWKSWSFKSPLSRWRMKQKTGDERDGQEASGRFD